MESEGGRRVQAPDLLEEIYVWDTGPHDLFGSTPYETSKRIRTALDPFFAAASPASQRSVPDFRRVVTNLVESLYGARSADRSDAAMDTHWSASQDTAVTPEGEVPLRVNTALGVLRHCQWVATVFSSVPEASVLLR